MNSQVLKPGSTKTMLALVALLVAVLQGIGTAQTKTPNVVASFGIIADMAQNVSGNTIQLFTLVPNTTDPHGFEPSAKDAKTLAQADIVLQNGLGFETWMQKLQQNAASTARVVTLSAGIKTLKLEGGETDPHAWWDMQNAIVYTNNIAKALAAHDPKNAKLYMQNAAHYTKTLMQLHAWAKTRIASVAAVKRTIVTNHDALGYLARAYGLRIVGTVIPGGSTETTPSAKMLANLIATIKKHKVAAIFPEAGVSTKLAQTIAAETGARVAPALYTDSLGNKNFTDAFRHNINTIVAALTP